MIDSLKSGILGFQGVIAATQSRYVKEFPQPHQCQNTNTGLITILERRAELLVDHPVGKHTVCSIRQCDNDVL